MISRKSTKTIEEAYSSNFGYTERIYDNTHKRININKLFDFLFVHNFDPWLLNAIKEISSSSPRKFSEFIMRLHTGESLVKATLEWDWEDRRLLGQRILKDLAESLIREKQNNPSFSTGLVFKNESIDTMRRALELDGYIFRDNVLWIPEESVLDVFEEEGFLESLMSTLKLPDIPIIKHHLELSITNYQDSKWDDSISNSRKVLEGILSQSAERFNAVVKDEALSKEDLQWAGKVRDYLEKNNILEKKEKETISKVYSLLSEVGGHPYIADRDQARLMRHLALTFSQFVLLRLEGKLNDIQTQNRLDDK